MAPKIELVVFDMDDVLAQLDRSVRLECLMRLTGRSAAELHAAILDSDFEPSAEAGVIESGDDYLAELNARLGSRVTRSEWVEARRMATIPNEDVLDLAERLRARYRVAMLTNNGWLLRESLPELLPRVLAIFGPLAFASCELRSRKPEPAVFESLLDRCQVAPAQSVFIDDTPEFVEGARRVGMHGVIFTESQSLVSELQRLGLDLYGGDVGPAEPATARISSS